MITTINEFKKINEAKNITVFTHGDKKHSLTNKDIIEFINDFDIIIDADNLPGWIYKAGLNKIPGFPTNKKKVKELLSKIFDYAGDVSINVRSDKPYENKIIFESIKNNEEHSTNKLYTFDSIDEQILNKILMSDYSVNKFKQIRGFNKLEDFIKKDKSISFKVKYNETIMSESTIKSKLYKYIDISTIHVKTEKTEDNYIKVNIQKTK